MSGAVAQDPAPSRVEIAFNRYYDYDETTEHLRRIAAAYPELVTLTSVGKSGQGRELWVVTVNAGKTGPDTSKPAMWIDGNIHGNEVQASEVVLYSIWFLTKSYGGNERLTELLDRTSFYFMPMVNPDGRQYWFDRPNDANSSRHNQRPLDNDRDGLVDEDPPNDLDGDGQITEMWKADTAGRYVRSQTDDRVFVRLPEDRDAAPGVETWTPVGDEGIDDDGDGRVNEDGTYGDDMNRNFPADWQPEFVQGGAGPLPLSAPETRALAGFMLAHPNIAAVQSYHNFGGMILRGPGFAGREGMYPPGDARVYDEMGRLGEKMLPYYRSMVIYKDLYRVHGGSITWAAENLGAFAFTNELWATAKYFQREQPAGGRPTEEERGIWQDRVAFGELFKPFSAVEHPLYGPILVGGLSKWSGRVTPGFMLEEECHRNFAFTAYHADQTPLVGFERVRVRRVAEGVWEVTAEVRNSRLIPTRSELARRERIGRPDVLTCDGAGARVVSGGTAEGWFDPRTSAVRFEPARLQVPDGLGSRQTRVFRFVVEGPEGSAVTLRYDAQRARVAERRLELREAAPDADESEE